MRKQIVDGSHMRQWLVTELDYEKQLGEWGHTDQKKKLGEWGHQK